MFGRFFTRARQLKLKKNFNKKFSTSTNKSSSLRKWMVISGSAISTLFVTSMIMNKKKSSNLAIASGGQDHIEAPKYPWSHNALWDSFDHASIRRGFFVYYTIAKACHSMNYVHYRELVNVALTEKEAKELASNEQVPDKPNDEGDVVMRPGALTDHIPNPYRNEQEARYMNNGSYPPDLSLIVKARHGGEDYIMALLTGYRDPPAGVKVAENMYYNPYFPGGQISMPPPLTNGAIEYEDGTEASISQMAKDVVTYLTWASYPEQDDRHLMGLKAITLLVAVSVPLLYYKRFLWASLKNRKIAFLRRTQQYKNKIRKNF